ncbi:hypothetical protein E2C01_019446 [Portunus trituberculatus]|uniref:Secreted protein n=1 Tax=Portunus trituberculatus TaxID=210409 RepID=A0A5B7DX85_PORTR|nr:hypothetical protein [Portunus trituberculatus]
MMWPGGLVAWWWREGRASPVGRVGCGLWAVGGKVTSERKPAVGECSSGSTGHCLGVEEASDLFLLSSPEM